MTHPLFLAEPEGIVYALTYMPYGHYTSMDDEREPAGPRNDGSGKGEQDNAGKNCEED